MVKTAIDLKLHKGFEIGLEVWKGEDMEKYVKCVHLTLSSES